MSSLFQALQAIHVERIKKKLEDIVKRKESIAKQIIVNGMPKKKNIFQ